MSKLNRKKETMLTQRRLKEVLHYDFETGVWTSVGHRIGMFGHGGIGKVHKPRSSGYVLIQIDKETYYAHRLAFLYVTGSWPTAQVDHINQIRSDNRWSNLRQATHSQNQHNKKWKKNNSGFLGVYKSDDYGWIARISSGKKGTIKYVGYFKRIENAALAYNLVAHEMFGEFAKFNRCNNV